MSGTWKTLPHDRRILAESAFVAVGALDDIAAAEGAREPGRRKLGFGDVYAYVNQPDCPLSPELKEALAADPRLREALMRLLSKTAGYRAPRSAAASTQLLESRHGEGFTIRLRPSRAEPLQVYVVIELLSKAAEPPKTLFITDEQDGLLKQALPEARGGTVQLLAETGSDLIQALRNPRSEVFLR